VSSTRDEEDRAFLPPLVGHEGVMAEQLEAIHAGRVHHALCLTGPWGVGKALAARHLGRAFLCPDRTQQGACGACRSCRRVVLESHPDWQELRPSGGSVRGSISVDQVREMTERVWLKPGEGQGRVVLIEEAHLLGEVGQNALLKTLEEPPPSTLFLLVTPRAAELLPTVLSRCQILRFSPLSGEEVRRILQDKGSWRGEDLDQAVEFSEGSPGAALAFLEGQGRFLRERVRELLATPSGEWDPVGMVQELLASQAASPAEEGLTLTQVKRRRALLLVQLLQQEGARRFRASLLEGQPGGPYDPSLAGGMEKWLDRCFQAEQNILWNLDPVLALEILLMDLARP